ncbi:MAG: diguanylate cyclase [Planctomycetota bacterium]
MKPHGAKQRSWLPASLSARGLVLLVLVAVSIGLPVLLGHHLLSRRQLIRHNRGAEAFLAVALQAYFESAANPAQGYDEWMERLVDQSQRVRWGGVFGADGQGYEFRRLTSLRRELIVEQIAFDSDKPVFRPLEVRGIPSHQFYLLSVPQPEQVGTLAAVVDLGEDLRSDATPLLLLGLAGMCLIGLLSAYGWFILAIERPIRHLGRWSAGIHGSLADAALDCAPPVELSALVRSLSESQAALRHWRGEAGSLRESLDELVDARTRQAERVAGRARKEADTDALTGLLNRRALQRELPELLDAQVACEGELTAVVFDVDHFKPLNDKLGHPAGDELLGFVGELLNGAVRQQNDLAVRYGGDEFVLVLPGTCVGDAVKIAQRLHALFMQRVRTLPRIKDRLGISIGVAGLREHAADSWEDLLAKADAAMYHAKQRGLPVASYSGLSARKRRVAQQR